MGRDGDDVESRSVGACDGWTFFWTDLGEHLSEATTFGFAQRALLNSANHQKNNVGSSGATVS